jgi:hypothetical protein
MPAQADRRVDGVIIYRAKRRMNSMSGNPGWRFETSAGPYVMAQDSALGYAVENLTWTEHGRNEGIRVIGNPAEPKVTLLCNMQERVWGFEYQGEVLL